MNTKLFGAALLAFSFFYPFLNVALADSAGKDGKAIYVKCAACHLASGEGVIGAFPPIADRVKKIAAVPDGRQYLVKVLSGGLAGEISVDGISYYGTMPGFGTSLTDEEMSSVLNYIAKSLDKNPSVSFKEFTQMEVKGIRKEADDGMNTVLSLRQALFSKHSDIE